MSEIKPAAEFEIRRTADEWIMKIHPRTETTPARVELNPTMAFERAVERFVVAVNTNLSGPVSTG